MKRHNFVIAALLAFLVIAFINNKTMVVQANTSSQLKSNGIISYNNNTPDNLNDDAFFDATDLISIEARLNSIEQKLFAEETKLNGLSGSVN